MSEFLEGVVLEKLGGFKDAEAWSAGTSPYYVLDVQGAALAQPSADEGVILRASEQVGAERFAALVGQKVRVEGVYLSATPYTPKIWEQYPIDFDGKPLPRGAGFQVVAIEPR